jgi:hypothetical protein
MCYSQRDASISEVEVSNIPVQLIDKPAKVTNSSSRKPLPLEPTVISALEKLAHDEGVSAPVMLRRMVEQVLTYPTVAESVLEYIHDYWWGYKVSSDRAVTLRVDSDTYSLLLYLAHTSAFPESPDHTAEMLVSFYSQVAKTVPSEARALSALAAQHQRTSTQPRF